MRWFANAPAVVGTAVMLGCAVTQARSVGARDPLSVTAATSVEGTGNRVMLVTRTSVRNTGSSPVHVEYGDCDVRVRIYKGAGRDGTALWDSDRRGAAGSRQPVCLMYQMTGDLAAGKSIDRQFAWPLLDILGDSLPDGHYYFTAARHFDKRPALPDVPAGDAYLAVPRPPLVAIRQLGPVSLSAQPVAFDGAGQILRGAVTIRLEEGPRFILPVSRACALTISAYRDAARRDAAPLSGAADWAQTTQCDAARDSVSFGSWQAEKLLTARVPAADIVAASGSGKYYFALAARVMGRVVYLSGGEANLSR